MIFFFVPGGEITQESRIRTRREDMDLSIPSCGALLSA